MTEVVTVGDKIVHFGYVRLSNDSFMSFMFNVNVHRNGENLGTNFKFGMNDFDNGVKLALGDEVYGVVCSKAKFFLDSLMVSFLNYVGDIVVQIKSISVDDIICEVSMFGQTKEVVVKLMLTPDHSHYYYNNTSCKITMNDFPCIGKFCKQQSITQDVVETFCKEFIGKEIKDHVKNWSKSEKNKKMIKLVELESEIMAYVNSGDMTQERLKELYDLCVVDKVLESNYVHRIEVR